MLKLDAETGNFYNEPYWKLENGEIHQNDEAVSNRFIKFNEDEVRLIFDCLHSYSYAESEWKERKLNESLRRELMKRLHDINKERYAEYA